jgi:hypothetical protein
VNPEAAFDCLAITTLLGPSVEGVLPGEIHVFAYLACLLSLYNGQPVTDWGYSFAGTSEGAPFSVAIDDAVNTLRVSGDLVEHGGGVRITEAGRTEYGLLAELKQNASRVLYLTGACSSVLALPIGMVRNAIAHEPAVKRALALGATRLLLERVDVSALYEQFSALAAVLGEEVRDFMAPAVTWLMFLTRTAAALHADPAIAESP